MKPVRHNLCRVFFLYPVNYEKSVMPSLPSGYHYTLFLSPVSIIYCLVLSCCLVVCCAIHKQYCETLIHVITGQQHHLRL